MELFGLTRQVCFFLSVKLMGDQKRRLFYNRPTIDSVEGKKDNGYEVKQCCT
jgi:hypothetical protein